MFDTKINLATILSIVLSLFTAGSFVQKIVDRMDSASQKNVMIMERLEKIEKALDTYSNKTQSLEREQMVILDRLDTRNLRK